MGFQDRVPPSFPPLGSSCPVGGPRLLGSRWQYLVQSVHSAGEEGVAVMVFEFLCASYQYCKRLCLIGAKHSDGDRWRNDTPVARQQWASQATSPSHRLFMETIE